MPRKFTLVKIARYPIGDEEEEMLAPASLKKIREAKKVLEAGTWQNWVHYEIREAKEVMCPTHTTADSQL